MLLADQDRSLWDAAQIDEGRACWTGRSRCGGRGPYVAAGRDRRAARRGARRTGPQIAALYAELAALTGSPVVELNRAVAIAEADGARRPRSSSSTRLDLDGYHYLHATRADLLRRLGRDEEARGAYERALELAHTEPERRFLEGRLAALQDLR